jgi:sarcosine/dimethylglycine N-methyltransferase
VTDDPTHGSVSATQTFYEDGVRVAFEAIWGEHLHLGLFARPEEPLIEAQGRAIRTMAESLDLPADADVLEVACGMGPAARHLARRYGCRVSATNIAPRQLAQGRDLTEAAGLGHLVHFAGADYHQLPFADGRFDLWWCQEALLHSPDKARVLGEARRVLGPGGRIVVSDITVPTAVSDAERALIYARVQSPVMWDKADYERALVTLGFGIERFDDWSAQVAPSYAAIKQAVEAQRADISPDFSEARIDAALAQFQLWVDFARAGKIGWLHFRARTSRPDSTGNR